MSDACDSIQQRWPEVTQLPGWQVYGTRERVKRILTLNEWALNDDQRERVFVGNLQQILAGRWQRDERVDNRDLLLPKQVRRVTFAANVPLKTYGPKKALVFTSTRPNIYGSADLTAREREAASEYAFTYPSSSLQSYCALQALYQQDQMLSNKWHLKRTNFQCEWD